MSKSLSVRNCLLPALASVILTACNSAGVGDERATIVSSDAVTIGDNVSEPLVDQQTVVDEVAANPVVSEPVAKPADTVDQSAEIANTGGSGEILTIADLLASLDNNPDTANSGDTEPVVESPVVESDPLAPPADNPVPDAVVQEDPPVDSPEPVAENPPVNEEVPSTPDSGQSLQQSDATDTSAIEGIPATEDPVDEQGSVDVAETVTETLPESEVEEPASEEVDAVDPAVQVPVQNEPTTTVPEEVVDTDIESTEPPADANSEVDGDTAANPVEEASLPNAEPVPEPVGLGHSASKNQVAVNCERKLPCSATAVDASVTLVVENVYRHPETGRLAIAMSVTANRDTALRWDSDVTSTDDVATTYNGTSREFSGFYQVDNDNNMVTLLAGTTLLVVQHFREMPSDTTLAIVRFDTGYIEAGVRTVVNFSNMPLDPVLGQIVDCENLAPCTWVSNDNDFSVSVTKASGLWQTGRLRLDIEIYSAVGMSLNMFSSDAVVGNDGSVFTPRSHSLNGTSDYKGFTEQLLAEGVFNGYQDFLKNGNRLATSLKQVKLGITRVDAPGAGSPVFRNLPIE